MANVEFNPYASSLQQIARPQPLSTEHAESGVPSFKNTLIGMMNEVNALQQEAGETVQGVATGEVQDLHEAVIAMQKADVSFKFMMEVRNKLVEAYQDVMRMQL